MYHNIGKTIKFLAKFLFGVDILLSIISAIGVLNTVHSLSGVSPAVGFSLAILYISVAILVSFVKSLFTYGYGQLIESSDAIRRNTTYLRNHQSEE